MASHRESNALRNGAVRAEDTVCKLDAFQLACVHAPLPVGLGTLLELHHIAEHQHQD